MPTSSPRPCSHPGCGVLVHDGTGRCEKHPRRAWGRAAPPKRITGRKLQQLRAELFARDPFCAECKRNGLLTRATLRDHVKPLAEGGQDVESNVQGLCEPCHEAKTLAEALRGRARHAW